MSLLYDDSLDAKTSPSGALDITLEHAEPHPVHFTSKRALRDYARKNKLVLGALDGC